MALPWVSIFLACFFVSWYSLVFLGLDVILAPILKFWLVTKPFLLKTLPALLIWLWMHTGAKLYSLIGELAALLATILSGWKAWSAKKMIRQATRLVLSLSARFVAASVLLNLLFGHERRGLRLLPKLAMRQLRTTPIGRVARWWKHSTERKKRLALGLVLCIILILAGQAILGVSVLLFDLAWEIVLLLWRLTIHLWRLLSPIMLKMVPNFIGKFVTGKLLPLIADVVPIIKDDHRVIYLRFNIRRNIRRIKAWLYLKSRARRGKIRKHITPLISEKFRARKTALLNAATKLRTENKKR